jgi:BlaI family transcriptional regulator, penicillinase repressor
MSLQLTLPSIALQSVTLPPVTIENMQPQKGLGELERQVMEFLWAHGPATGEAVRAAIGKPRPLTDSTIRTVLRRLEAKQYVRHEMDGRQFLYSSAREPRKVAAEAVRSALKNFCRGSLEELLTGLVDHRVVDSAELRRLAEKIEVQEKKRRKA